MLLCRSACSAGEPCIRSRERAQCTMQIAQSTMLIADIGQQRWIKCTEKEDTGYSALCTARVDSTLHSAQITFHKCTMKRKTQCTAKMHVHCTVHIAKVDSTECTLHRWTAQSAHCKGGAPSNESCMQRPLMIAILNPAGGEHATNTPVERITLAVKEKP